MKTVIIDESDIEILYSVPEPGGNLKDILRCFVFLNRAAPPRFSVIKNCLAKAFRVGCLNSDGDFYIIEREWYKKIHAADESASNEIESLLEFQERFSGVEVPVSREAALSLSEDEYNSILQELQF